MPAVLLLVLLTLPAAAAAAAAITLNRTVDDRSAKIRVLL
jgi:hypothetical protein